MTREEKRQAYFQYQTMLTMYERALLDGDLKTAEAMKCDILLKLSYLLEMIKN